MKIVLDYSDELKEEDDKVPMEQVFRLAIEISSKANIPVSWKHGKYEVFITAEEIKEK